MNEGDSTFHMIPNLYARTLLEDGSVAANNDDMELAEDKWSNSIRAACSYTCFDPGVIFTASVHLSKYYSSEGKEIQCNVSIQQALSAFEKVFDNSDECPPKIQRIVKYLKNLRDRNNTKPSTCRINRLVYPKEQLMAIRNSMSTLSTRRPNELFGEITISSVSSGRGKNKKVSPAKSQGSSSRNEKKESLPVAGASRDSASAKQWASALDTGIAVALGGDHEILKHGENDTDSTI